jgi:hypothetical protein
MHASINILNHIIENYNINKILKSNNNNIIGFSLICKKMFTNDEYYYFIKGKKIIILLNHFKLDNKNLIFIETLLKISKLNPTYVCNIEKYFENNVNSKNIYGNTVLHNISNHMIKKTTKKICHINDIPIYMRCH